MNRSNELVDHILAVLDANPKDLAGRALALTECIARFLIEHLPYDSVTARTTADSLTQRLVARITNGEVINRNDYFG